MGTDFVFVNQHWFWPVIIGSVLLYALFIWKEGKPKSIKRGALKIVLAFFAIGALTLMALKPAKKQNLDKGRAVLITEGYADSRLDSLLSVHKTLKIIRYGKGEPMQRELDSVSTLFVLGNGPAPFDFWQFEGIPTTYLQGTPPDGITRLKFTCENEVDSELQIRGNYNNPKRGMHLVLQDPGGNGLDSVALRDTLSQRFSLSTPLKVNGNFVYRLLEKDSMGQQKSSEPLPISVKPKKQLSVLMINSFPTFESKYLKNFLAEMNHNVLVKSQMTKGKYKFEYFNRERTPIYGLSQENVKQFDILIIDAASYKNLSAKELTALMDTARDYGLGIFIQPDAPFFQLPKSRSHFDFLRTSATETQIDGYSKVKIDNYPFRFDNEFLVQPIQTSNENISSAYKRLGKGRVGTTVLQNTYQLVLEGHTQAYRQLWTELISAISNRTMTLMEWKAKDQFAVKNQPYDFSVRTADKSPMVVNVDGNGIPLFQDPDLKHLWNGTTYPRNSGWNQLMIEGDSTSTYHFYVTDSTAWRSLVANQTMAANKRFFNDSDDTQVKKTVILKPLNPIWFFAIFLLCMGLLWFEPKVFGS